MHGEAHLRPWEIQRLTEPEILLALDADTSKRRPPSGSVALTSDDEIKKYLKRRREMTPEERLREALED